ncbi:tol-pal system YbgF family protein [Bernardetia sp. OM2101]|uniref:tetratricopeptide repeat protein n=1 Tax=Bernardetia sp. OM2101 TaxID=3344876 RepID=UPI0035CFCDB6
MSQSNTNKEKKIRSILERSSNIDVKTLQKYIDKKLTKEELHEVEKQLLNSDFATEASEGFANADFKVNIAASTNWLNKEIKNYNKERGFYKKDYRVFYAAASVALVFVVLFGLMKGLGDLQRDEFTEQDAFDVSQAKQDAIEAKKDSKNSLALNEEQDMSDNVEEKLIEKLKYEEITQTQSNSNSNQNNEKIDNNLALNQDESRTEQDFSTSDIWIRKKEKIENEDDEVVLANSEQIVASSPIVSSNRNKQMNYDSSNATNTNQLADDDYDFFSNIDNKNNLGRNQKSPKEILFDAMQSYENKKYTEAILLFDSYLVTNPNDAQALYFGGMSYYENHNYTKSIPLLEKFLKQKSDIVYQKNNQDAEWYLANSYLKIKQKQKAKTILQKIANSGSKYASQAKSLLKK